VNAGEDSVRSTMLDSRVVLREAVLRDRGGCWFKDRGGVKSMNSSNGSGESEYRLSPYWGGSRCVVRACWFEGGGCSERDEEEGSGKKGSGERRRGSESKY
jgi:hypothetical protein